MTHKETALDYFGRKFHCSQSVLAAFAPECGLTEEQALKLGACFGSGMRKGEVCGACVGALMVLGALYGQYDKADPESRIRANTVNDKMMERFAKNLISAMICSSATSRHLREQSSPLTTISSRSFVPSWSPMPWMFLKRSSRKRIKSKMI